MKYPTLIAILVTALDSALLALAQAPPPSIAPPAQSAKVLASAVCAGSLTYDQLTEDERKPPPPRIISLGKSPIELTIQALEFNDAPADSKTASAPDFCFWRTLGVGVQVSTTGESYSFADGEGAIRGGGGDKLSPSTFERLRLLINQLPDDHHRVPPPTRRVQVEVERNGAAAVRLYDSADLPDAILEMLRLTGVRINVVTPAFKPDRVIPPDEASSLASLAAHAAGEIAFSPDGSIGVIHDFRTMTLIVYQPTPGSDSPTLPSSDKILCVIREFWQPPSGGYDVNSEFSPDGRYLLVTWGNRIGALIYDTGTWQPVTDPRLFPQNLKEYLHTPDWDFAVAVTGSGEVMIWDRQAHRVVSKFSGFSEFEAPPVVTDKLGHPIYTEPSAEIWAMAFSPDRSRVAVYGGPNDVFKLHLDIFEAKSGQKQLHL